MTLQNVINNPILITRSGLWISLAVNQNPPITNAIVPNTLRAFPWVLSRSAVVSTIRSEVFTLAAATGYRLGVYTDNSTYPNKLIAGSDTGIYDSSTVGVKSGSFSATLAPALYWVVINANGAPLLRSTPTAAIANVLGNQGNIGSNSAFTCWSIAQAFAALPPTFPTGASLIANVSAPVVQFFTI
jgi:hypothetical protein